MHLDEEDRKFIETASHNGHALLAAELLTKFREEMDPYLRKVDRLELTMFGTENNPNGVENKANKAYDFIGKAKLLMALLPPATVAVWETAKTLLHIGTR